MTRKQVIVKIEAIIEYNDDLLDVNDIDNSVVICFRKEDKYTNQELFLIETNDIKVIEYSDINIEKL
jgi:hypothetical protein